MNPAPPVIRCVPRSQLRMVDVFAGRQRSCGEGDTIGLTVMNGFRKSWIECSRDPCFTNALYWSSVIEPNGRIRRALAHLPLFAFPATRDKKR